jgi:hypothetical protein
VSFTRGQTRLSQTEGLILDDVSRDELEEELTKRTQRLAQSTTPMILDKSRLKTIIDQYDVRIRRAIETRMSRRSILGAVGTVVLVWVLALTPYLLFAAFRNWVALVESLTVALVSLGLLCGLAAATLVVMKRRLLHVIAEMNREFRGHVASVREGASEFEGYLSDLIAFMRGQGVLKSTRRSQGQYSRRQEQRSEVLRRIVDRMDREKLIVQSIGHELNIQRDEAIQLQINDQLGKQVEELFHLPVGRLTAHLNSTGETIDAPYDFITGLSLDHLELREPARSNDRHIPGKLTEAIGDEVAPT